MIKSIKDVLNELDDKYANATREDSYPHTNVGMAEIMISKRTSAIGTEERQAHDKTQATIRKSRTNRKAPVATNTLIEKLQSQIDAIKYVESTGTRPTKSACKSQGNTHTDATAIREGKNRYIG